MDVIKKYILTATHGEQTITLPAMSLPLSVHEQNKNLCIWFLVDTEQDRLDELKLIILDTDVQMVLPEKAYYIDTVIMSSGLVYHIWTDYFKTIE